MKVKPAAIVPTQSNQRGVLGTACDCWVVAPGTPPGGPWEEVVSAPDADGFYTVEFLPIAPPDATDVLNAIAVLASQVSRMAPTRTRTAVRHPSAGRHLGSLNHQLSDLLGDGPVVPFG